MKKASSKQIIEMSMEELENYSHLTYGNESILNYLRDECKRNIDENTKIDFYESFNNAFNFNLIIQDILRGFYNYTNEFDFRNKNEEPIRTKLAILNELSDIMGCKMIEILEHIKPILTKPEIKKSKTNKKLPIKK